MGSQPPDDAASEGSGLTPAQRALLDRRLQRRGTGRLRPDAVRIPRRGEQEAPLSAEQAQLFFHDLLSDRPLYNEAVTIIHRGPTDLDALAGAFRRVMARHEMWRSVIRSVGGAPRQLVLPPPDIAMPLHDLSSLPEAAREPAAAGILVDLARPGYDLRRGGQLVRPALVRISAEEHRLLLAMHHIVFDGVSLYRVVLPELRMLYDASRHPDLDPLPEPPLQYADYALWQREVLPAELDRQLPWWREALGGAPPELRLPTVHPRSAARTHHGVVRGFEIEAALVASAYALARSNGTTLFPVLMAAFALVLQDHGAGDDVVFATVADLRRRAELRSMVGYCLTPLVLRMRGADRPGPADLVRAAHRNLISALEHAVPFEPLVERLQPARVDGAAPLFQAMLVLEPPAAGPAGGWELRMLEPEVARALGSTKTDVHLELDERPDGRLAGRLFVNRDLFAPGYPDRFIDDFTGRLGWLTSGGAPPVGAPA